MRSPNPATAILLAAAAASPALHAQVTLALDGQTSVVRPIGSTVTATIDAAAGRPAALALDVSAGPTNIFGITVPLGLTPSLVLTVVGIVPPSGTLSYGIGVPFQESLHADKLYLAAITLDPSAPQGIHASNGCDLTLVARPQLAGNALPAFPHFEHVAAINRQAPASIGLDPRFVYAAGKTADVYVVAAKTAAQWDANPALVDVRGAPQTVAFPAAATTIQQNTFALLGPLPGPNEAPGSGDTRIGVGYDVVIDFGQDGVFTDGVDFLDGYSDEAGFYVTRDLARGGLVTAPTQGPHPVSEITYTGGSFLGQNTYYPTNIASLGVLPLVVVSHGNGHDYQWYDHIGYHLASHGFVVMSHQNNTMPGSHTAATTTLTNTDFFLGNLATIGGGVLNGRVDGNNITWIGHSRGGDGVARAYDQLFRGVVTTTNFTIADIKLVSSMAPVDFGGWSGQSPTLGGNGNGSHPHDANFHLWVAQADADVHGCAGARQVYWYTLHERATHKRQSISLYGVGHGDLHDGGGSSVASGPNLIGRPTTHGIMRGYLLALVSHHILGDVPSRDFLWRQYESFRAVGAPTTAGVTVNMMFREGPGPDRWVIDDFQTLSSPFTASSGALVSFDVQNFTEGRADDANNDFTDTITDPFNGFTFDDWGDGFWRSECFACVFGFDGGANRQISYDLAGAQNRPNFRDYAYLSFRAAQVTRHPHTIAALGDLTFEVAIEDELGVVSAINIGAYGGGIEEPYQRNSGPTCGAGLGWNSEFETVRIRLTDFLNNGAGIDLSRVRRVHFRFGPTHGSPVGRIALDEIELNKR
jgi:hypothetical protein